MNSVLPFTQLLESLLLDTLLFIPFAVDQGRASTRILSSNSTDIESITGHKPTITNFTSTSTHSVVSSSTPIIIGTLGHSSLIDAVVNNTKLDVTSVNGVWETFHAQDVQNPLPGINRAYVMLGADKRGTIFNIYTHSESFGVSPWYW